MDSTPTNPKVLISYSHDSEQHMEKVLAFCDHLREDGVDCIIDQFIASPTEGWPRWMINQINVADFVLVVATSEYSRRFSNGHNATGRGVKWEGLVITQELYSAGGNNTKFVPVVLSPGDTGHIPIILQGATCYDVSDRQSYNDLYRHITGQARAYVRVPGPVQAIPPLMPRGHRFDTDKSATDDIEGSTEDFEGSDDVLSGDDGHGGVATATDTELIELRLDRDFKSYTDADQQKLLAALGQLLGVTDEVRVISRRQGSVRILLEMPAAAVERLLWAVQSGDLADHGVVDATSHGMPAKTDIERRPINRSAIIQRKPRREPQSSYTYSEILEIARGLFESEPDWVTFFREILGVDGVVRRQFTRLQDLMAFERSSEFDQIQKWLVKLREQKNASNTESEPTRVIVVRIPKSMHEYLRAEAHDLRTSMNKLCISKLLQVIEQDLIPTERSQLNRPVESAEE